MKTLPFRDIETAPKTRARTLLGTNPEPNRLGRPSPPRIGPSAAASGAPTPRRPRDLPSAIGPTAPHPHFPMHHPSGSIYRTHIEPGGAKKISSFLTTQSREACRQLFSQRGLTFSRGCIMSPVHGAFRGAV